MLRRIEQRRACFLSDRDDPAYIAADKVNDVPSLTETANCLRPLLKAGVHAKVVSERLGHASIGITLDTHSHVMPGMREEAAEKFDAGLRAALAK